MVLHCAYNQYKRVPAGFTLIEVIVAMVVFTFVSASLFYALTSADRIKARGTSVMSVSTLARNESENIKNIAQLHGELIDTSYEILYGKKEYSVERKIIKPFNADPFANVKSNIEEIEIVITEKNKQTNSWHFNLLQGYVN
jgi:prepilin-type N-terminal cleavage/methylation domain-containing protein